MGSHKRVIWFANSNAWCLYIFCCKRLPGVTQLARKVEHPRLHIVESASGFSGSDSCGGAFGFCFGPLFNQAEHIRLFLIASYSKVLAECIALQNVLLLAWCIRGQSSSGISKRLLVDTAL